MEREWLTPVSMYARTAIPVTQVALTGIHSFLFFPSIQLTSGGESPCSSAVCCDSSSLDYDD